MYLIELVFRIANMSSVKKMLSKFESTAPEIIFEWNDPLTNAKGWMVINSLRGGASGGGTRMRKGLTLHEVISLAKTMEVKFTVSGPPIGGAKSGIDFDPTDVRKNQVLERWYQAVSPILKAYYGTGGDMNIDEVKDVVPLTEKFGLWHPQEGIVEGHYKPKQSEKIKKIGQLRLGVPMIIGNPDFSPDLDRKYTISDMITGYGVAESVIHYYKLWKNESVEGKSVLIQGWGNVGAAAGFYLAKAGMKVKGIMDKFGVVVSSKGFDLKEITSFLNNRKKNTLISAFKNQEFDNFWNQTTDVFLPCAGSRLVDENHLNRLIENGCKLISSGANVPFNNAEILFGDVHAYADRKISVIPDFIANCGMARTFAYCMGENSEITSAAIFKDISNTIFTALKNVHNESGTEINISEIALKTAIKKLI